MLRHVAFVRTEISSQRAPVALLLTLLLALCFMSPWWRRRYISPKRRLLQEPHRVPSQKTASFKSFFHFLRSQRHPIQHSYTLVPSTRIARLWSSYDAFQVWTNCQKDFAMSSSDSCVCSIILFFRRRTLQNAMLPNAMGVISPVFWDDLRFQH
jgi:hypothetical protein